MKIVGGGLSDPLHNLQRHSVFLNLGSGLRVGDFDRDSSSATTSAMPKNMRAQRQTSVDSNCYDRTKFGRQKAMADSKYGHDTQGVTGSSPVRPTERPTV